MTVESVRECASRADPIAEPGQGRTRNRHLCGACHGEREAITMQTKKIFLASSSELKEDRKEFEIFINRKNKGVGR
jgi:hypothetical protein